MATLQAENVRINRVRRIGEESGRVKAGDCGLYTHRWRPRTDTGVPRRMNVLSKDTEPMKSDIPIRSLVFGGSDQ